MTLTAFFMPPRSFSISYSTSGWLFCGFVVLWFCGFVVLWFCCFVVLLFCFVVLLFCCFVVLLFCFCFCFVLVAVIFVCWVGEDKGQFLKTKRNEI